MTDLAGLLVKAATFAKQWRDQEGCNAQVLDELADAIEGYLGTPPLRGEHPDVVIIDDPIKVGLDRLGRDVELVVDEFAGGMRAVRNAGSLQLEVLAADGHVIGFPPTATALLGPGDEIRVPPESLVGRRPVSDSELEFAQRLGHEAHRRGADYLWAQRLPDGRGVFLLPWSRGGVQLSVGTFGEMTFHNTWYYDADRAVEAWRHALGWDGQGEPTGWHRHAQSGRVR